LVNTVKGAIFGEDLAEPTLGDEEVRALAFILAWDPIDPDP
jgi:hypothetical protein